MDCRLLVTLELNMAEKFIENNKGLQVLTHEGYKSFAGIRKLSSSKIYIIRFSDNSEIKVTGNHKFFFEDMREIQASELFTGDTVLSEGGFKTIAGVGTSANYISGFDVYDLVEVADTSAYYTNEILSHNCNFNLSGETALEPEKLNYIRENFAKEPIMKEGPNQELWIWRTPETNKHYIIGADVSKGDSSDFSAAQIVCVETLEQVAEFKAMIDKERYGQLLCKWGMDYNGAMIVIEDNYGERTIQKVIDLHYPNLFWMDTKFKGLIFDNMQKVKEKMRSPGWHTSTKTRPLVLENVLKLIRESVDDESGMGGLTIRSTRLCTELETWGYYGGRLDHAPGKHDDLIFSMAIAAFIQSVYSRITEGQTRDAVEFMKHFSNSGKLVDTNFGIYGAGSIRNRNTQNQYDFDGMDIGWLATDKQNNNGE